MNEYLNRFIEELTKDEAKPGKIAKASESTKTYKRKPAGRRSIYTNE
ncbi:MAG: hypothetical protein HUJ56_01340 [Erysipelotrichaceae bacterium]|nr:hypothetical protein [Erysipelotrichaceae bacterium]